MPSQDYTFNSIRFAVENGVYRGNRREVTAQGCEVISGTHLENTRMLTIEDIILQTERRK